MKSTFVKIGLIAAIAFFGFSCGKDKGDVPQEIFNRTVKVSLTKGSDTKTAVVENGDKASYVWTDGDQDNLFIYENGVKGEITGAEYTDNMKKATFTVSFPTSSSATEFIYVAKYTSDVSNSKNPKLEATQNPLLDSYDPSADVMVSDTMTLSTAATSLQFVMHRVITVNKMTLTGMVPGEKISKVEFQLDKIVAGYYQEKSGLFTGSDKTLTLEYDNKVVASDGTFPVYFVCAPVEDASIVSVAVTTDKYNYTKPSTAFSKKISFRKGVMSKFTMNLSGYASPISTSKTYTLVNSDAELLDGEFIIAASGSNKAMGYLDGTIHTCVDIAKSEDKKKITVDNTSNVLPVRIIKTGNYWTIQNNDPKDANYDSYLAWESGNTSIERKAQFDWIITVSSGVATIKAKDSNPERFLQYNASNTRFCCYQTSSNQYPVALYIGDGGTIPVGVPAINVTSDNPLVVNNAGGSQTINYTIVNPKDGVTLTASADVSWITDISTSTTGLVTFNVASQAEGASTRSGVITLKYSGATDVTVSVLQEPGEGGGQAANGWLELPAKQTGSDFYNGVFKVGTARNYSYMYQYSTYTTLWTAYPLYSATIGSSTISSESSEWLGVPYVMTSDEIETKGKTWAPNPNISESLQVNIWDGSYNVDLVDPPYVADYYARGHQIPNADRSADGKMQTQTYYATNSTPQIQNRFNGYIWGRLETDIRECVKDTVYVVTGATFHKVEGSETITYIKPAHDSRSVPVPYYYWKVLLKVKRSGSTITSASTIGFWFEHKQYSNNDYTPYAVSVDQIEAWTGFNFFVNLPENLQTTAEKNTSWTTFKNF